MRVFKWASEKSISRDELNKGSEITFDHLTMPNLKLEWLSPVATAIKLFPCDMKKGIGLFETSTSIISWKLTYHYSWVSQYNEQQRFDLFWETFSLHKIKEILVLIILIQHQNLKLRIDLLNFIFIIVSKLKMNFYNI